MNNQTTETELPTYAANQQEAAEAFNMTVEEFEVFKKREGFPPREKKGWNIDAIKTWIESSPESTDDSEAAIGDNEDSKSEDGDKSGEGESGRGGEKPPSPPPSPTSDEPPYRTVIIEIPICDPAEGSYIGQGPGHIDVRLDRETQLPAFRQIHAGLRAANATLPNGKPVESAADVIRYLAALVASEME